jgi:hypothetical protein
VPTSVLLAVLAAAGLLALAPALVRRYDATERLAAERATSTARVLTRRRRRRTVPGRRPVNPPRIVRVLRSPPSGLARSKDPARVLVSPKGSVATGSRSRAGSGGSRGSGRAGVRSGRDRSRSVAPNKAQSTRGRRAARRDTPIRGPASAAVYRRRRVFAALTLLNLAELAGVAFVGSGFWIGFSATATLLVVDIVYLRRTAVLADRRRRSQARRAAWIAAQQAAVRQEHARRAEQRREAVRRAMADREAARRAAVRRAEEYVERYGDRATGTDPTHDPGPG